MLPVYYSDNYISLIPNETRVVTIEADEKELWWGGSAGGGRWLECYGGVV